MISRESQEQLEKLVMDKAEEIYRTKNCTMREAVEESKALIIKILEEQRNGISLKTGKKETSRGWEYQELKLI